MEGDGCAGAGEGVTCDPWIVYSSVYTLAEHTLITVKKYLHQGLTGLFTQRGFLCRL
jgi:hypothetical protein